MSYSIAEFVEDLRKADAANAEPKSVLPEIAEKAARLAEDLSWVKLEFYAIEESQGIGITVLHEEPDKTLAVQTVVWAPGKGVLPHDHQTWGVVVGLDGVERNTIWRREDDGATPGRAVLKEAHVTDVGRGQTLAFLPDDIHSVQNRTDTPTLSLHVYGKSLAHVSRSEFDPAADVVRPCPIRVKRPAA